MFDLQKEDNVVLNRHKYIGGSDIPTILGINKYKSAYELAKEKTGIQESLFEGNEYTTYGNILEPQIREYINTMNDTHFKVDTFIDENQGFRSNVDGIDLSHGTVLEIKTHGKTPSKKVYYAQIQFYLYQTGLKYAWLAMYQRPDNLDATFDADRLVIEEIEKDDDFIVKMLDSIETFRIRCEYLKENPNMTEEEFFSTGTDIDKTLVKLNNLAPKISKLKETIKELETYEKSIKEELYEKMETSDIKKIETPLMIVTRVLPSVTQKFDEKAFLSDHPEYVNQYQKKINKKGYVMIKTKDLKGA